MIDLDKNYGNKNINELFEIVESIDSYESSVIEYCLKKINEKNLPEQTLKLFSKGVIKKRFYEYFSQRKYVTNTLINIDSVFLEPDEVKKCFEESKLEYSEYVKDANWGLDYYG